MDLPGFEPDRAVIQLQEATSYLRYLLHSLMCRHARDSLDRAHGLQFWLSILMTEPPAGAAGAGAPAAEGPGAAPGAGAMAVFLQPAGGSAGRRLLGHRLACQNPYCALCAGTCELYTRGNGLRQDLPAPAGLSDMDTIVQELSLALGSINL